MTSSKGPEGDDRVDEASVPVPAPMVEGGDVLPQDARARLSELQTDGGLFTSDLSVNEFVVIRDAGFHPRGLVLGSSIYHVGWRRRPWRRSVELARMSQALYTARELAMDRMVTEAEMLGADGVVGVRLDANYYAWGRQSAEFIALGTAVSAEDRGGWRTPSGAPFTSDLSGQEFWVLMKAGFVPVGLVMGVCVYHVAHRQLLQAAWQLGTNSELTNFTQALYEARELAMTRMQAEADQLNADGIVGVQLVEKSHFLGSHVIEFLAIGTAVRRLPGVEPQPIPALLMTVDQ